MGSSFLEYSKVWSVRNRGLGFARLDFLSGLRNRAFARPQFLISTKESAKIFFAAAAGEFLHRNLTGYRSREWGERNRVLVAGPDTAPGVARLASSLRICVHGRLLTAVVICVTQLAAVKGTL